MEDIKVGDIVGNTVVGFVWKVLKIEGDKLLIKNTKTNKEKKVYSDGYYKSKSDSNKKIGEGSEIQFKHLLSMKTLKGTIDGEYDHNYWVVDSGKDGMFMVPKNDKSIKSLNEAKVEKIIKALLHESATAQKFTYKNFYIASTSLKDRIDAIKRPARMPKPAGWQATALPSGLKPIDYGHCEGIFVDKYGKLRGEKMYEDLFINGSNNIGWSIAKGILQEKVAMLKALDIQIPVAKYDSLSYWLIYKVYMKEKFPQIAQKLGFK